MYHLYAAPCETGVSSCSDGVCVCKPGYVGEGCCDCDTNYYRASNGTCQSKHMYIEPTGHSCIYVACVIIFTNADMSCSINACSSFYLFL